MQFSGPLVLLDTPFKHVVMILSCFFLFFPIVRKSALTKEYKGIFIASSALYAISVGYQLYYGEFKPYALKEFYFLVAPLIYAISIYKQQSKVKINTLIDALFVVAVFLYIVEFSYHGRFTLGNFLSMFDLKTLFIDSISPLGSESDTCITFLLFYIFYCFRGSKKKWFAMFFAFLGFKRLVVAYLILSFFAFRNLKTSQQTKRTFITIAVIIFCLMPTAIYLMCSDDFSFWFYRTFDVDFNSFTMTRFEIINAVIDSNQTNYGLGTITDYLERRGVGGQFNMHNDILRIYMECTFIGTILFTYNYFNITKRSIFSFAVILFMFIEMFAAHVLGPGCMLFWILSYMCIIYFNSSNIIAAHKYTNDNIA